MAISNLILVIAGCLIVAVTSRFLYLASKQHTTQSKKASIHFLMVYGGTALGFLIGFFGSIRFLQTKWEDGSFMWNFIVIWALGLIGFFVGLFASSEWSGKTH
jgi:hypothetical protein